MPLVIDDQVKAATNDPKEQILLQLRINQQESALKTAAALVDAGKETPPPQPMPREVFKQNLILSLGPNYMKPGTQSLPDSMAADAERDASFLMAAVNKVIEKL